MKKVTILFVCFIMIIILGFFLLGKCEKEKTARGIEQNEIVEMIDFKELMQEKGWIITETIDQVKQSFQKKEIPSKPSAEKTQKQIRVLIKNSTYEQAYHPYVAFRCKNPVLIVTDTSVTKLDCDTEYIIKSADVKNSTIKILPMKNGENIKITSIQRKDEVWYHGYFECFYTEQGIALVNELPVETYLLGVIPSEMPASYPIEALKAQAVVARSYAYYHMQTYAYPQVRAHIDDSTSFQVYQNIMGTEQTKYAVEETENKVLVKGKQIQECMYYSTSAGTCPKKEKSFQKQIQKGSQKDIEYEEGWYRWRGSFQISWETLKKRLLTCQKITAKEKEICQKATIWKNMSIQERAENGQIADLMITTNAGKIHVYDQYTIRVLLAVAGTQIEKKDLNTFTIQSILPSPFFYFAKLKIKNNQADISIVGGGFGHGIGMSQNGAKQMGLRDKSYQEILKAYYQTLDISEKIGYD